MARRSFLPALRGLTVETKSLQPASSPLPDLEAKTVYVGGNYSSTATPGVTRLSGEDRAAGYDLESVIVDGYERVVWVYKSVEFIAGHFSRLPFAIGRGIGTDEAEIKPDHPLYQVLNVQANPLEYGRVFKKRLAAQVLLSKRGAFVEVTRSRSGRISRLDLLPPDRVRPVPDPDGDYLLHFEYTQRNGGVREIKPDRIRWVRDPHPTDPFSGVTPLDPAGSSIELDRLGREYNTSFIKNDSRPGGVLGVDADTLSDEEMARLERRMEPGAHAAGRMSVIATGPGGLRYVDTTTRPRDMAYSESAANAKLEILGAFGLSPTLFGDSAGRTYDNAENDKFNAWSETLVPFFDLIAQAFRQDVDEPGWVPFIDTSTVEVLELPRRKKREEARAEFNDGLRSVNEYRPLAGLDPVPSAYADALWISPSKAPIPAKPEDAAELGLAAPGADPAAGGDPGAGEVAGEVVDGETAAEVVANARAQLGVGGTAADAVAEARAELPGGEAAAVVADARGTGAGTYVPGEAAGAVADAREGKALEVKALDPGVRGTPVDFLPSEDEARRAELAIAAGLDAMLARQSQVVIARTESPKIRKGTRYWTPDSPADTRGGDQPIDTSRIVDEERWAQETEETLTPLVEAAAVGAAAGLLAAFAGAGAIASAPSAQDGAEYAQEAAQAAAGVSALVLQVAGQAMREWLRDLRTALEVEQLVADDIGDLTAVVRRVFADEGTGARRFADSLALSLAQAAVNGGRDAAAAAMTLMPQPGGLVTTGIVREWVSQRDDRVRPSHKDADGTNLPVGVPFVVGGAPLRFPCDPLAPAQETRGCRCRARYRTTKTARFLLPPVGE